MFGWILFLLLLSPYFICIILAYKNTMLYVALVLHFQKRINFNFRKQYVYDRYYENLITREAQLMGGLLKVRVITSLLSVLVIISIILKIMYLLGSRVIR